MKTKKIEKNVAHILEDILGCKWSLRILTEIRNGTKRPGAIRRSIDGLAAKVMNERLAKMVKYGILDRKSFGEIPPRVEYSLTGFGLQVGHILDEIEDLQKQIDERQADREGSGGHRII